MSFTKQLIKEIAATRAIFGCEPKKLNSIDQKECNELVTLINQCKLQNRGKYYSNDSDFRIFDFKDDIKKFTNIWKLICENLPRGWFIGPVMAAHLSAKPESLGSGEGWHRDSWFGQKKIIFYLSDVTNNNGPFQYIPNTSSFNHKLISVTRGQTDRIEEAAVDERKVITLVGQAGTSYLFDGTMLHRGKPPIRGERYAVTAYLYSGSYSEEKIKKYFNN